LVLETYNQYLLPRDFDEVPTVEPNYWCVGGLSLFFLLLQGKRFGYMAYEEIWG